MVAARRIYEQETEFMYHGACRGHKEPEIFFPGSGENLKADRARAVCVTCEVQTECLKYAIKCNIGNGIWGGLAERERRRYAREQRRKIT